MFNELERYLCDLGPPTFDHQRMPSLGNLLDFCRGLVQFLALEGSIGDGPTDRVVLLARDELHRATTGVPAVDRHHVTESLGESAGFDNVVNPRLVSPLAN